MKKIVVSGRKIEVPDAPITPEKNRRTWWYSSRATPSSKERAEGNFPLKPGQPYTPSEGDTFTDSPRRTKGSWNIMLGRRQGYIRAQAEDLDERFGRDGGEGIRLDPNYNWLIIPKYPLPARWKQHWTSLMLLFGEGYPDVPPTGFYLTIKNPNSPLQNGGSDYHLFHNHGNIYAEAPDLSAQGWSWYCVHAKVNEKGGWKPSNDPHAPDNLFTFLNMAREALSVDF